MCSGHTVGRVGTVVGSSRSFPMRCDAGPNAGVVAVVLVVGVEQGFAAVGADAGVFPFDLAVVDDVELAFDGRLVGLACWVSAVVTDVGGCRRG